MPEVPKPIDAAAGNQTPDATPDLTGHPVEPKITAGPPLPDRPSPFAVNALGRPVGGVARPSALARNEVTPSASADEPSPTEPVTVYQPNEQQLTGAELTDPGEEVSREREVPNEFLVDDSDSQPSGGAPGFLDELPTIEDEVTGRQEEVDSAEPGDRQELDSPRSEGIQTHPETTEIVTDDSEHVEDLGRNETSTDSFDIVDALAERLAAKRRSAADSSESGGESLTDGPTEPPQEQPDVPPEDEPLPDPETEPQTMSQYSRITHSPGIQPDDPASAARRSGNEYPDLLTGLLKTNNTEDVVLRVTFSPDGEVEALTTTKTNTGKPLWPEKAIGEGVPEDTVAEVETTFQYHGLIELKPEKAAAGDLNPDLSGESWIDRLTGLLPYKIGIEIMGVPLPKGDSRREAMVSSARGDANSLKDGGDVAEARTKKKATERFNKVAGSGLIYGAAVIVSTERPEDLAEAQQIVAAALTSPNITGTPKIKETPFNTQQEASGAIKYNPDGVMTPVQFRSLFREPTKNHKGLNEFIPPNFNIDVPVIPEENREGYIPFGNVLDNSHTIQGGQDIGTLFVREDDLRGVIYTGASGFGKTEAAKHRIVHHLINAPAGESRSATIITESGAEGLRSLGARLEEYGIPVSYIQPDSAEQGHVSIGVNIAEHAQGYPMKLHVNTMKEIILMSYGGEGEGRDLLSKYLTAALEGSVIEKPGEDDVAFKGLMEEYGFDLRTNKYKGIEGEQYYPPFKEFVRKTIEYSKALGYGPDGKTQGDIAGFLNRVWDGIKDSKFFDPDYTIPPENHFDGVTIWNIEGSKELRKVIFSTLTQIQIEARRAERSQSTSDIEQPVSHIVYMDEAGVATTGAGSVDEAAEEYAATLRQYGISFEGGYQRAANAPGGHFANARMVVAFRTTDLEDQRVLASKLGLDLTQARLLGELGKGEALVKLPNVTQPFRVHFPDPKGERRETNVLTPAERLVETGPSGLIYLETENAKAREFLQEEWSGKVLSGMIDLNIIGRLNGLKFVPFKDQERGIADAAATLRDKLYTAEGRRDLQCAIETQVTDAVNARVPELLRRGTSRKQLIDDVYTAVWWHIMDPDGLGKQIDTLGSDQQTKVAKSVSEHVGGAENSIDSDEQRQNWTNLDNILPHHRYNAVIEDMKEYQRTHGSDADRFPQSDAWQEVLGHPLPGKNAQEQVAFLETWQLVLGKFVERSDADQVDKIARRDYQLATAANNLFATYIDDEDVQEALLDVISELPNTSMTQNNIITFFPKVKTHRTSETPLERAVGKRVLDGVDNVAAGITDQIVLGLSPTDARRRVILEQQLEERVARLKTEFFKAEASEPQTREEIDARNAARIPFLVELDKFFYNFGWHADGHTSKKLFSGLAETVLDLYCKKVKQAAIASIFSQQAVQPSPADPYRQGNRFTPSLELGGTGNTS